MVHKSFVNIKRNIKFLEKHAELVYIEHDQFCSILFSFAYCDLQNLYVSIYACWCMCVCVCVCAGVLVCWCVGVLVCMCVCVWVLVCCCVGVHVCVCVCCCVDVCVCVCVAVLMCVCVCVRILKHFYPKIQGVKPHLLMVNMCSTLCFDFHLRF